IHQANQTIILAFHTLDTIHDLANIQNHYLITHQNSLLAAYTHAEQKMQTEFGSIKNKLIQQQWPSIFITEFTQSLQQLHYATQSSLPSHYPTSSVRQHQLMIDINNINVMLKELHSLVFQIEKKEQAREQHYLTHNHTIHIHAIVSLVLFGCMLLLFIIISYWIVMQEVNRNRMLTDKLEHEATHDTLTHLPNRRYFTDWLTKSIALAKRDGGRLAVMFIDLDGFKRINDNYGHTVGDSVLLEATHRFQMADRDSDILARLGGDEFVVLIPRINAIEDAVSLANRMISILTLPASPPLPPDEQFPSASIGIAIYPNDGLKSDELLHAADLAMYHAKMDGKHCYRLFNKTWETSLMNHNKICRAIH
ncbi:MAG: GGDEF domain-containing protein, partial [Pseudomonadota bacterium]|nr:GGDEF domain-containing protein [Pseudomonadota bacterium]